ncbi:MAG: flagellar type III secretion system pore protein FliP [Phycisphaerales bacterium]|nr:flagellar type III secretion system pore protein FliP [Phycisphaerales bacterium]
MASGNAPLDITNPLSILDHAGGVLPSNPAALAQTLANPTSALNPQPDGTTSVTTGGGLSTSLSILILLTVLTVAPSLLIMTTSFTRMVIVLSLLRQAIGTQALPPSQIIVGLAMFLSLLVMAPTFERVHREAIVPLQQNEIDQLTAWTRAKEPLRDFMFAQIEHADNWGDVMMLLEYRGVKKQRHEMTRGDVDMLTLIPAFVLSELKVAFLMGFRLYLPFLVIDMVISSVLISMGMLMLPPVLISLPFKLLMFVLVDGWHLVVGGLLNSFAVATPVIG